MADKHDDALGDRKVRTTVHALSALRSAPDSRLPCVQTNLQLMRAPSSWNLDAILTYIFKGRNELKVGYFAELDL